MSLSAYNPQPDENFFNGSNNEPFTVEYLDEIDRMSTDERIALGEFSIWTPPQSTVLNQFGVDYNGKSYFDVLRNPPNETDFLMLFDNGDCDLEHYATNERFNR